MCWTHDLATKYWLRKSKFHSPKLKNGDKFFCKRKVPPSPLLFWINNDFRAVYHPAFRQFWISVLCKYVVAVIEAKVSVEWRVAYIRVMLSATIVCCFIPVFRDALSLLIFQYHTNLNCAQLVDLEFLKKFLRFFHARLVIKILFIAFICLRIKSINTGSLRFVRLV